MTTFTYPDEDADELLDALYDINALGGKVSDSRTTYVTRRNLTADECEHMKKRGFSPLSLRSHWYKLSSNNPSNEPNALATAFGASARITATVGLSSESFHIIFDAELPDEALSNVRALGYEIKALD